MSDADATLWFDFTDPLCYLLVLELDGLQPPLRDRVRPRALELLPPPAPLLGITHDAVAERWAAAREIADATVADLAPPALVPWTRKAHELHLHAGAQGRGREALRAIFEAYVRNGLDIGRVDVLVTIGESIGLDRSETKAVLDVDRYEESVLEARADATADTVSTTPTVVRGGARLEGFHNRATLGTFLRDS